MSSNSSNRPVHPAFVPNFHGTGVEHSCWAYLTTPQEEAESSLESSCLSTLDVKKSNTKNESSQFAGSQQQQQLPNLVTGQSSTLNIYSLKPSNPSSPLLLLSSQQVSGNICVIKTLPSPNPGLYPDGLLVGFSGHPRISIISPSNSCLHPSSIIDLTSTLLEHSRGATSVLEQDILVDISAVSVGKSRITVGIVLGKGISICFWSLIFREGKYVAQSLDPWVLDWGGLRKSLEFVVNSGGAGAGAGGAKPKKGEYPNPSSQTAGSQEVSICSPLGEILSVLFLGDGTTPPKLAVLHSNPKNGPVWSGRISGTHSKSKYTTCLTCFSISEETQRGVVLWQNSRLPWDARGMILHDNKILVHSPNGLVLLQRGCILASLATNGFSHISLETKPLLPNPSPLPRLGFTLDRCRICPITGLVVLHDGSAYGLEYHDEEGCLSLSPTSYKFGCGSVCSISAFDDLVFVGSRMGDSVLLRARKKRLDLDWGVFEEDRKKAKMMMMMEEDVVDAVNTVDVVNAMDVENFTDAVKMEQDVVERMPLRDDLSLEEELLYQGYVVTDDSSQDSSILDTTKHKALIDPLGKRPSISTLLNLHLIQLDTLPNLGPLGQGCTGPLSTRREKQDEETSLLHNTLPVFSPSVPVYPCGYAESGGLAVFHTPGLDMARIQAELDICEVRATFWALGKAFLVKEHGGMCALQREVGEEGVVMKEVIIEVDDDGFQDIFTTGTFLCLTEWKGCVCVIILHQDQYRIVVFQWDEDDRISLLFHSLLAPPEGSLRLNSMTDMETGPKGVTLHFGCVWDNGMGSVISINMNGLEFEHVVWNVPLTEIEDSGQFDPIVSMDIFSIPSCVFAPRDNKTQSTPTPTPIPTPVKSEMQETTMDDTKTQQQEYDYIYDEDDRELYGIPPPQETETTPQSSTISPPPLNEHELTQPLLFYNLNINTYPDLTPHIAICRQSGHLSIHPLSSTSLPPPIWQTTECGFGHHSLPSASSKPQTDPLSHSQITEIRFFTCGSDACQSFNFILCNAKCDLHLYTYHTTQKFQRVSLGNVISRQSLESKKHTGKLVRKKILPKSDNTPPFRHGILHRFHSPHEGHGVFASTPRPLWFLQTRKGTHPSPLYHKSRHAAPAGSSVGDGATAFCLAGDLFLTVHQRIGRVGSQRLTLFQGPLTPGAGETLCLGTPHLVSRIPLGVTVRSVSFLDNTAHLLSTPSHPLYALLISKHTWADQSHLNDDGLTAEQRNSIQTQKEDEKTRRQVEADLGGFDLEQEWVEEIEREDFLQVSNQYGDAPPLPTERAEIWLMDGYDWSVLDRVELQEFEHGMVLTVVPLTECNGEDDSDEVEEEKLFLAVGTGIVDQDGEDISSTGRLLLLEVKRNLGTMEEKEDGENNGVTPRAKLHVAYEKEVLLGPVTALAQLSSGNKNRLVVGAGAEVTVEQWGINEKLTQVGFFHANMQVKDLLLFKTFILLSDAYDSLHFLVWRESDKSLTLLAKDYEPTPIYASGLINRGPSLFFVACDDRQNLQFFQYSKGNRLVLRGDFHLGTHTVSFRNNWCRSSLLVHSATVNSTVTALRRQDPLFGRLEEDQRLASHFGTADGGFSAIVPLNEQTYWRFTALQSVMGNALENNAGLSHRAWRLYRRTARRGGCRSNDRKKGVLDAGLLFRYAGLSLVEQEELACAIGTTVDLILDNLLELECAGMIV